MLDLLCKDFIGKTIHTHRGATRKRGNGQSALEESSDIGLVHDTDSDVCTMENRLCHCGPKFCTCKVVKEKICGSDGNMWHYYRAISSQCDLKSDEARRSTSSRRRSKTRHAKREDLQVKRQSKSSKSSMEKSDLQSEPESGDMVLSPHKQQDRHSRARVSRTDNDSSVGCNGTHEQTLERHILVPTRSMFPSRKLQIIGHTVLLIGHPTTMTRSLKASPSGSNGCRSRSTSGRLAR